MIAGHLYVSRNTAETHLRHVYRKLNLAGRGSCAAYWRAGMNPARASAASIISRRCGRSAACPTAANALLSSATPRTPASLPRALPHHVHSVDSHLVDLVERLACGNAKSPAALPVRCPVAIRHRHRRERALLLSYEHEP
jgi:hypothetical protein